ncbi:hypothetical protein GCM10023205_33950 [Yinghuangia aomiensis]|uniref:Uncharacterized protein n=1 Tax=Yinghuangia aomiensis TaxID=676205 RepID=A0ABP9HBN2_9ACTN
MGELDRVLRAVDLMRWNAVPGPSNGVYRPGDCGSALRALAVAEDAAATRESLALLESGGIVHLHSATVYPTAVAAAPILLDIADLAAPAAAAGAASLLEHMLGYEPFPGFERVAVAAGRKIALCCAVARMIREHPGAARGARQIWRPLVEAAAEHRWFDEGDGPCVTTAD